MAFNFVLHALRGFVAMVLLLQSRPVFRTSTPCPQEHCIYLPVTSNPAAVTIYQIESGAYSKGILGFAFGEVINNSNFPVYNVVVQATFVCYVACSSYLIFTNTTFLTATFPGQTNAFNINTFQRFVTVFDSKVLSWDITPTLSFTNLSVATSYVYTAPYNGPNPFEDPAFYAIVTGTLRNDTGNTLRDVQLYVWNVKKKVSNHLVISQVLPSATVTFSTTLFAEVRPTDTIRIVAQGIFSP